MSKYDPTYDVFTNRYRYFLSVSIKQLDTHVYFDLYDYVETERFNEVEKRLVKKDVVLPKEIFLYFRLCELINSRTIEKNDNCRWFQGDINKLLTPSDYYILGVPKSHIKRWHKENYYSIFFVHAIDKEFISCTLRFWGSWHYEIKELKFRKPVFEKIVYKLNAIVNYSTIWSEVEFRVYQLSYNIKKKELFRNYRTSLLNCFDVFLKTPTRINFENIFKILAPTIEGLLKDYITLNSLKNINTNNLGTITNSLSKHSTFSKEFIETLKVILKPIRDFTLHGNAPSERVSQFVVLMVFDLYEELAS
jgi:hypothetical protein